MVDAIRADEITAILKRQLQGYEAGVDVAEVGTVLSVGDGIARIYGLREGDGRRAAGLPQRRLRPRAQPRGGPDRRRADGRVAAGRRGRRGPPHRPRAAGAGGRRADRPRGRLARTPGRRQGSDRRHRPLPARAHRAGRHRAPAGARAAPDRAQGGRRHDPDRPRPARADHRRPPGRQDRGRDRHHHQPEGHRRHLHLRRDRPEALDHRAGGEDARGLRRDGPHHRGGGFGVGAGARSSTSRPTPVAPWASTSSTTAATRW